MAKRIYSTSISSGPVVFGAGGCEHATPLFTIFSYRHTLKLSVYQLLLKLSQGAGAK